ncbi:MAG: quaternary ammonium compound-resistance protein SugE [Rickettsiales bacterium]
MAKAAQTIPIGTAYGIWVGIGAIGVAILGIFLFKEPSSALRLLFLLMLLISIIGLKLTSGK